MNNIHVACSCGEYAYNGKQCFVSILSFSTLILDDPLKAIITNNNYNRNNERQIHTRRENSTKIFVDNNNYIIIQMTIHEVMKWRRWDGETGSGGGGWWIMVKEFSINIARIS